jgi:deoxyribodipyrimidine photo-lyase
MWFASIWIFTLRLPWEIGADFFLRHLLDGDPASNTLSWRWVGGLHTKGKTYAARASNISKYTSGRFNPIHQLCPTADPLIESEEHPKVGLPLEQRMPRSPYLLLLTEEDCTPEITASHPPAFVLGLTSTVARSPGPVGDLAAAFAKASVDDGIARCSSSFGIEGISEHDDWAASIVAAAKKASVSEVVTSYLPVGPSAEALQKARKDIEDAGLNLTQVRRPYDTLCWPHATRGFFALKKKIPVILSELGLQS